MSQPLTRGQWTAILDAMEDGLEARPPVLLTGLPADPGPVPPELVSRARRVLRRMGEVEAELVAHQAEIGRELRAVSAARAASAVRAAAVRPVPYFLDARA